MNLIFMSGPQGAGKTTLANLLAGPDILVPELTTQSVKLDTSPDKRLALKICLRSLENYEYLSIAQKNPDKIILGNRCIYDQLAFDEVYVRRGWISEREQMTYDEASRLFYLPELLQPQAIVLNPGYDIVMEHLHKRWEARGSKWREKDTKYIRLACEVYEEMFRDNEHVFYIDHEIDLHGDDVNRVKNWFERVRTEVFV